MIKNVIFDIGNVLAGFDWLGMIRTKFDEETEKVLYDVFWNHGFWGQQDLGILSEEEILRTFISFAPDYEEQVRWAYDHIGDTMHHMSYSIPWVKELTAKGYKVFYLSNYHDHVVRQNPGVLDFILYMDGGVFSDRVKLLKPDPAIYAAICNKYHLKPQECIFIDDTKANTDAATAFGIHGIQFQGYEKSYPEISAYLKENGLG